MSAGRSIHEAVSRIDRLWLGDDVSRVATRWMFIFAWAASAAYALQYLGRGWFPYDLGCLAQPAERILGGEWPHRDFDDPYTGGLAFVNAGAFALLGVRAMSIRSVLFAVFLAWVPTVWYLARRLAGPVPSAVVTFLAAAWTIPMYAEGMPSWYNLFLATFGTAALFRWVEVRRRRWLVLAGLAGGASILIKVVGLYYVAGALLFLAYAEASSSPEEDPGRPGADVAYRAVLVGGALLLAAVVAALVWRGMGPGGMARFAVPALVPPITVAVWIGSRPRRGSTLERAASLLALGVPFLAGVAIPVALYILPYVLGGALDELYRGTLVLPARRLLFASWSGPPGDAKGPLVAAALVFWVGWAPTRRRLGAVLALAGGGIGVIALAASSRTPVYLVLWRTLIWLPPWMTLVAAGRALSRRPGHHRLRLAALLCVFGLVSLVEVPFAAPIYFFYAAPLLALLGLALAGDGPMHRRGWLLSTAGFFVAFTVVQLNPGFIRVLGVRPGPNRQDAPLAIPRAVGLTVNALEKDEYETVVGLVRSLTEGPYIYATPDSPEIYFLTGLRNPTRSIFEFLDPEPERSSERILEILEQKNVRVIVVNLAPPFSRPVSAALIQELRIRYPFARAVGNFVVAWKQPVGG